MSGDPCIVVTVDGSAESRHALELACVLAKSMGATLRIVTVVPPPPIYPMETVPMVIEPPQVVEAFRNALAAAKKQATGAGVSKVETDLLEGPVVDSIVQYLRQKSPTMAVLGARGLSAGARLFLGSVSDGVVHHAPCPVLIVRPQPGPS